MATAAGIGVETHAAAFRVILGIDVSRSMLAIDPNSCTVPVHQLERALLPLLDRCLDPLPVPGSRIGKMSSIERRRSRAYRGHRGGRLDTQALFDDATDHRMTLPSVVAGSLPRDCWDYSGATERTAAPEEIARESSSEASRLPHRVFLTAVTQDEDGSSGGRSRVLLHGAELNRDTLTDVVAQLRRELAAIESEAASALSGASRSSPANRGSLLETCLYAAKLLPLAARPVVFLATDGIASSSSSAASMDEISAHLRRHDFAIHVIRCGSASVLTDRDWKRLYGRTSVRSQHSAPGWVPDAGSLNFRALAHGGRAFSVNEVLSWGATESSEEGKAEASRVHHHHHHRSGHPLICKKPLSLMGESDLGPYWKSVLASEGSGGLGSPSLPVGIGRSIISIANGARWCRQQIAKYSLLLPLRDLLSLRAREGFQVLASGLGELPSTIRGAERLPGKAELLQAQLWLHFRPHVAVIYSFQSPVRTVADELPSEATSDPSEPIPLRGRDNTWWTIQTVKAGSQSRPTTLPATISTWAQFCTCPVEVTIHAMASRDFFRSLDVAVSSESSKTSEGGIPASRERLRRSVDGAIVLQARELTADVGSGARVAELAREAALRSEVDTRDAHGLLRFTRSLISIDMAAARIRQVLTGVKQRAPEVRGLAPVASILGTPRPGSPRDVWLRSPESPVHPRMLTPLCALGASSLLWWHWWLAVDRFELIVGTDGEAEPSLLPEEEFHGAADPALLGDPYTMRAAALHAHDVLSEWASGVAGPAEFGSRSEDVDTDEPGGEWEWQAVFARPFGPSVSVLASGLASTAESASDTAAGEMAARAIASSCTSFATVRFGFEGPCLLVLHLGTYGMSPEARSDVATDLCFRLTRSSMNAKVRLLVTSRNPLEAEPEFPQLPAAVEAESTDSTITAVAQPPCYWLRFRLCPYFLSRALVRWDGDWHSTRYAPVHPSDACSAPHGLWEEDHIRVPASICCGGGELPQRLLPVFMRRSTWNWVFPSLDCAEALAKAAILQACLPCSGDRMKHPEAFGYSCLMLAGSSYERAPQGSRTLRAHMAKVAPVYWSPGTSSTIGEFDKPVGFIAIQQSVRVLPHTVSRSREVSDWRVEVDFLMERCNGKLSLGGDNRLFSTDEAFVACCRSIAFRDANLARSLHLIRSLNVASLLAPEAAKHSRTQPMVWSLHSSSKSLQAQLHRIPRFMSPGAARCDGQMDSLLVKALATGSVQHVLEGRVVSSMSIPLGVADSLDYSVQRFNRAVFDEHSASISCKLTLGVLPRFGPVVDGRRSVCPVFVESLKALFLPTLASLADVLVNKSPSEYPMPVLRLPQAASGGSMPGRESFLVILGVPQLSEEDGQSLLLPVYELAYGSAVLLKAYDLSDEDLNVDVQANRSALLQASKPWLSSVQKVLANCLPGIIATATFLATLHPKSPEPTIASAAMASAAATPLVSAVTELRERELMDSVLLKCLQPLRESKPDKQRLWGRQCIQLSVDITPLFRKRSTESPTRVLEGPCLRGMEPTVLPGIGACHGWFHIRSFEDGEVSSTVTAQARDDSIRRWRTLLGLHNPKVQIEREWSFPESAPSSPGLQPASAWSIPLHKDSGFSGEVDSFIARRLSSRLGFDSTNASVVGFPHPLFLRLSVVVVDKEWTSSVDAGSSNGLREYVVGPDDDVVEIALRAREELLHLSPTSYPEREAGMEGLYCKKHRFAAQVRLSWFTAGTHPWSEQVQDHSKGAATEGGEILAILGPQFSHAALRVVLAVRSRVAREMLGVGLQCGAHRTRTSLSCVRDIFHAVPASQVTDVCIPVWLLGRESARHGFVARLCQGQQVLAEWLHVMRVLSAPEGQPRDKCVRLAAAWADRTERLYGMGEVDWLCEQIDSRSLVFWRTVPEVLSIVRALCSGERTFAAELLQPTMWAIVDVGIAQSSSLDRFWGEACDEEQYGGFLRGGAHMELLHILSGDTAPIHRAVLSKPPSPSIVAAAADNSRGLAPCAATCRLRMWCPDRASSAVALEVVKATARALCHAAYRTNSAILVQQLRQKRLASELLIRIPPTDAPRADRVSGGAEDPSKSKPKDKTRPKPEDATAKDRASDAEDELNRERRLSAIAMAPCGAGSSPDCLIHRDGDDPPSEKGAEPATLAALLESITQSKHSVLSRVTPSFLPGQFGVRPEACFAIAVHERVGLANAVFAVTQSLGYFHIDNRSTSFLYRGRDGKLFVMGLHSLSRSDALTLVHRSVEACPHSWYESNPWASLAAAAFRKDVAHALPSMPDTKRRGVMSAVGAVRAESSWVPLADHLDCSWSDQVLFGSWGSKYTNGLIVLTVHDPVDGPAAASEEASSHRLPTPAGASIIQHASHRQSSAAVAELCVGLFESAGRAVEHATMASYYPTLVRAHSLGISELQWLFSPTGLLEAGFLPGSGHDSKTEWCSITRTGLARHRELLDAREGKHKDDAFPPPHAGTLLSLPTPDTSGVLEALVRDLVGGGWSATGPFSHITDPAIREGLGNPPWALMFTSLQEGALGGSVAEPARFASCLSHAEAGARAESWKGSVGSGVAVVALDLQPVERASVDPVLLSRVSKGAGDGGVVGVRVRLWGREGGQRGHAQLSVTALMRGVVSSLQAVLCDALLRQHLAAEEVNPRDVVQALGACEAAGSALVASHKVSLCLSHDFVNVFQAVWFACQVAAERRELLSLGGVRDGASPLACWECLGKHSEWNAVTAISPSMLASAPLAPDRRGARLLLVFGDQRAVLVAASRTGCACLCSGLSAMERGWLFGTITSSLAWIRCRDAALATVRFSLGTEPAAGVTMYRGVLPRPMEESHPLDLHSFDPKALYTKFPMPRQSEPSCVSLPERTASSDQALLLHFARVSEEFHSEESHLALDEWPKDVPPPSDPQALEWLVSSGVEAAPGAEQLAPERSLSTLNCLSWLPVDEMLAQNSQEVIESLRGSGGGEASWSGFLAWRASCIIRQQQPSASHRVLSFARVQSLAPWLADTAMADDTVILPLTYPAVVVLGAMDTPLVPARVFREQPHTVTGLAHASSEALSQLDASLPFPPPSSVRIHAAHVSSQAAFATDNAHPSPVSVVATTATTTASASTANREAPVARLSVQSGKVPPPLLDEFHQASVSEAGSSARASSVQSSSDSVRRVPVRKGTSTVAAALAASKRRAAANRGLPGAKPPPVAVAPGGGRPTALPATIQEEPVVHVTPVATKQTVKESGPSATSSPASSPEPLSVPRVPVPVSQVERRPFAALPKPKVLVFNANNQAVKAVPLVSPTPLVLSQDEIDSGRDPRPAPDTKPTQRQSSAISRLFLSTVPFVQGGPAEFPVESGGDVGETEGRTDLAAVVTLAFQDASGVERESASRLLETVWPHLGMLVSAPAEWMTDPMVHVGSLAAAALCVGEPATNVADMAVTCGLVAAATIPAHLVFLAGHGGDHWMRNASVGFWEMLCRGGAARSLPNHLNPATPIVVSMAVRTPAAVSVHTLLPDLSHVAAAIVRSAAGVRCLALRKGAIDSLALTLKRTPTSRSEDLELPIVPPGLEVLAADVPGAHCPGASPPWSTLFAGSRAVAIVGSAPRSTEDSGAYVLQASRENCKVFADRLMGLVACLELEGFCRHIRGSQSFEAFPATTVAEEVPIVPAGVSLDAASFGHRLALLAIVRPLPSLPVPVISTVRCRARAGPDGHHQALEVAVSTRLMHPSAIVGGEATLDGSLRGALDGPLRGVLDGTSLLRGAMLVDLLDCSTQLQFTPAPAPRARPYPSSVGAAQRAEEVRLGRPLTAEESPIGQWLRSVRQAEVPWVAWARAVCGGGPMVRQRPMFNLVQSPQANVVASLVHGLAGLARTPETFHENPEVVFAAWGSHVRACRGIFSTSLTLRLPLVLGDVARGMCSVGKGAIRCSLLAQDLVGWCSIKTTMLKRVSRIMGQVWELRTLDGCVDLPLLPPGSSLVVRVVPPRGWSDFEYECSHRALLGGGALVLAVVHSSDALVQFQCDSTSSEPGAEKHTLPCVSSLASAAMWVDGVQLSEHGVALIREGSGLMDMSMTSGGDMSPPGTSHSPGKKEGSHQFVAVASSTPSCEGRHPLQDSCSRFWGVLALMRYREWLWGHRLIDRALMSVQQTVGSTVVSVLRARIEARLVRLSPPGSLMGEGTVMERQLSVDTGPSWDHHAASSSTVIARERMSRHSRHRASGRVMRQFSTDTEPRAPGGLFGPGLSPLPSPRPSHRSEVDVLAMATGEQSIEATPPRAKHSLGEGVKSSPLSAKEAAALAALTIRVGGVHTDDEIVRACLGDASSRVSAALRSLQEAVEAIPLSVQMSLAIKPHAEGGVLDSALPARSGLVHPEAVLILLQREFEGAATVLLDLQQKLSRLLEHGSASEIDAHAAVVVDCSCPAAIVYIGLSGGDDSGDWKARCEAWCRWDHLSEEEIHDMLAFVGRVERVISMA
jgi:hypothetical protein